MSSHLARFRAHVEGRIVDTDVIICGMDSLPGLLAVRPELATWIRADVTLSTPWGPFAVACFHALPDPTLGVGLAVVKVDDAGTGRAN